MGTNLKEVMLPSSVVSIGVGSLSECKQLKDVTVGTRVVSEYMFSNCPKLKSVILLGSVERIEAYSFSNCPKLKRLVVPKSVKYIDEKAFDSSNVTLVRK